MQNWRRVSTVALLASVVPGLRLRSVAALASQSKAQIRSYAPHLREKIASSVAKGERRAKERCANLRQVCDRCCRPPTLCVCDSLPPSLITTQTHVLVLQHPNEFRKKNFSTVPLLRLVLEKVRVKVGYSFDANVLDLEQGKKPLLLFPGPDANELDTKDQLAVGERAAKPIPNDANLLILIDGTWAEAKRMVRESPALFGRCQQVQFASSDSQSVYHAVRKEPDMHCLSTLEACAKALDILEGDPDGSSAASEHLRTVLQKHVDAHLSNALAAAPRHNADTSEIREKNRRRQEIEHSLFDDAEEGSGGSSASTSIKNVAQFTPIKLDDGATIRALRSSDAPLVDSWWDHRSATSLSMVARCISADCGIACLGVDTVVGELCGCIVRYEGGAVGMLHVEESHRRRGYGSALLKEATRALEEQGEECVAFILDGNEASEALFAKEGWEREDPTLKKGTGKRRAKRKWIRR